MWNEHGWFALVMIWNKFGKFQEYQEPKAQKSYMVKASVINKQCYI